MTNEELTEMRAHYDNLGGEEQHADIYALLDLLAEERARAKQAEMQLAECGNLEDECGDLKAQLVNFRKVARDGEGDWPTFEGKPLPGPMGMNQRSADILVWREAFDVLERERNSAVQRSAAKDNVIDAYRADLARMTEERDVAVRIAAANVAAGADFDAALARALKTSKDGEE